MQATSTFTSDGVNGPTRRNLALGYQERDAPRFLPSKVTAARRAGRMPDQSALPSPGLSGTTLFTPAFIGVRHHRAASTSMAANPSEAINSIAATEPSLSNTRPACRSEEHTSELQSLRH